MIKRTSNTGPVFSYNIGLTLRTHYSQPRPLGHLTKYHSSLRDSLFLGSSWCSDHSCNTVHISLTSWGDNTSTEVRFLYQFDSFQRLETLEIFLSSGFPGQICIYLSDDVSVGLSEVGWSETIILGATIDSSESTNTGVTSHVQVAGQ